MTSIWTVANLLSGARIAAAPALLAAAWCGQAGLFLAGLCAAFATDVADGFAARRLGQTSELGARLDSLGDLLLYAVLPLGVWWLWPDAIRAEAAVVGVALAAFVLPIGAGLLRWRRLTSYHTWGAKLSAWLVGGGTLALIVLDQPWLLRLAASVLVVSALEELAITAVLPRWTADVPTLRHALRIRQAEPRSGRARSEP
ncbi:MAG: CDP-alcohol phosphatidyltransferase family protein [Myxococcota bacterium]|nr:CDP-alcohol phosphatidyltransferase family protein [Myxococcota bacterium]